MGEDAKPGQERVYEIPDEFEEEFIKVMNKVDTFKLPEIEGHPDVCKIPDAAFKKTVIDFFARVNAKSPLAIPKPNC